METTKSRPVAPAADTRPAERVILGIDPGTTVIGTGWLRAVTYERDFGS